MTTADLSKIQTVFGPVPSRRLGQSLGVDPIPAPKTCNWGCVYCQLGRTQHIEYERKEWIPTELILSQLRRAIEQRKPGSIDWITFVGSGEPTLHSDLGHLIREAKKMSDIPVAVITNGALLYEPDVRRALLAADAVLPSVDAGSAALYRKINRPHVSLTFERLVDGLVAFRKEYQGKLLVEVMLIEGLNDAQEALEDLLALLRKISPDAVHLDLPTRPPAEGWVHPSGEEGLQRASAVLGEIAQVVHPAEGTFDLSGYDSVQDAIIGIITRHPMAEDQLVRSLEKWSQRDVQAGLDGLAQDPRAKVVQRHGKRFWSYAANRYK